MIRLALACLLAIAATAADLATEASAVRSAADATLAERRKAILGERTALAAKLQQAAAEAQAARSAREAAEADLRALDAAAPEREAAIAREVADLERLAARLRDAPERIHRLQRPASGDLTVTDRAGLPRTVPVTAFGPRQVALGPDAATRGAVIDGRVAGAEPPPLPAGLVPLDITGQMASAQPHGRGLAGWLAAGRMFIWPILVVGALGLVVAAMRLRRLLAGRPDRSLAGEVLGLVREGRTADARTRLDAAGGDLAAVLLAGLDRLADPRPAREAAIDAALLAAEPRLGRGLGLLALLAGIAPLLGLLGTVTGMIDLFAVIASQGAGQSRGLSGGISEALITTQAGMLVAVPLLVCHAILARIAERQRLALEEAGAGILGIEPRP